jgi:hypothetical protein
MKLTDKEEKVLVAILRDNEAGGESWTASDLRQDDCTNGTIGKMHKRLNWDKDTIKGVLGSLTKKKLVCSEWHGWNCFKKSEGVWLFGFTESGFDKLEELGY